MKNSMHLALAAKRGNADRVAELLAGGASPDSDDRSNAGSGHKTALQWALRSGSARCVKLLLDAGANPDLTARGDEAPPMIDAALSGNPEFVRALFAAGASVNALNLNEASALALACNQGGEACALALLSLGADPNLADDDGRTPAMYAAEEGEAASLGALIQAGADLSLRDWEGMSALDLAKLMKMGDCVALIEAAELRGCVTTARLSSTPRRV